MARTQTTGRTASTAPGPAAAVRRARVQLGDETYLWALIALELLATAYLRSRFRSAHGG